MTLEYGMTKTPVTLNILAVYILCDTLMFNRRIALFDCNKARAVSTNMDLTLIPASIFYRVWDDITYAFQNFSGTNVVVWE